MLGLDDAIGAVAGLADTIIKRKWPDATEMEKARLQQLAAEMQGQYQLLFAQMEINRVEAASPHIFVSGGRPAAIWVCVAGLLYSVLHPLITWAAQSLGLQPIPCLDTSVLQYLLGALLGVGAMRSYDKARGTETKTVGLK